jgi:hypothetical protein
MVRGNIMEKQFRALPDEYRLEVEKEKMGTIERLQYIVPNLGNGKDIKHLNVYLPYCYDTNDKNIKYNVLYLMHGGGEDENLIFGGPGQNRELKNILDNMIANGDIEPIIVVTPTFYGLKNRSKYKKEVYNVESVDHPIPIMEVKYFHDELINDLIPFVETKYNTYAMSGNKEDLIKSRQHRAFGGFSMGSVTTWYTYINCLDYFKYFIPLSGDCWVFGPKAGSSKAKETAEYLANIPKLNDYTPEDYYIFCATGNLDIAYPNMYPQIYAMKEMKDSFIYSPDINEGNFYFIVCDGADHTWHWVNQYIYNILPDLFKD